MEAGLSQASVASVQQQDSSSLLNYAVCSYNFTFFSVLALVANAVSGQELKFNDYRSAMAAVVGPITPATPQI
jgi:hypothetical protein